MEKLSANDLAVFQAGGRDEFHVDLNALAGIAHLLIGLGNVLGVWRLDRHDPLASQNTVQTGDGTLIAALSELHPEDNQTGIGGYGVAYRQSVSTPLAYADWDGCVAVGRDF